MTTIPRQQRQQQYAQSDPWYNRFFVNNNTRRPRIMQTTTRRTPLFQSYYNSQHAHATRNNNNVACSIVVPRVTLTWGLLWFLLIFWGTTSWTVVFRQEHDDHNNNKSWLLKEYKNGPNNNPAQQRDKLSIPPSSRRSMSACLLVLDDTIKLTEWLAYHYTLLPLGRLIVAVDPHSQHSEAIYDLLKLWNQTIDITLWTNDTWMEIGPTEWWPKRDAWKANPKTETYKLNEHRRRQRTFAYSCMREYAKKPDTATWTLFIDTDEFLVFNYRHNRTEDWNLYDTLGREKTIQDVDRQRQQYVPLRNVLPEIASHDNNNIRTVMDFLEYYNISKKERCLHIPGLAFEADHYENNYEHKSPLQKNLENLMTLRYTRHGKRVGTFSKALIDLSQMNLDWIIMARVKSIHNPNVKICGQNGFTGSGNDYIASVFRLNHYVGSKQAWMERKGDPRNENQRLEAWIEKSRNVDAIQDDDDIRPWIDAFEEKVGGSDRVETLLLEPLERAYQRVREYYSTKTATRMPQ